MHYYSFHVSDYIHDTAHLSPIEDLAFRRLLDLYYTQERPIPNKIKEVSRKLRMTDSESAIEIVLQEFFIFDNDLDCWRHKRCDETIKAYQEKAERNRRVGKLGGRPRANPEETQMVSKQNPNQEPITNNHKPIVKAQQRGSRLAQDFELTEDWVKFCRQERPELIPHKVFSSFKDYWIAQPGQKGVKLDWFATWRNWVRNVKHERPTFAQQAADVARTTVEATNKGPDPALLKIAADREKASPMPAHIRQHINSVLRKA